MNNTCNLCFKIVGVANSLQMDVTLRDELLNILKSLSLNSLSLKCTLNSFTCLDCVEMIRKVFTYKSQCPQIEDNLWGLASLNEEKSIVEKSDGSEANKETYDRVCQFCLTVVEDDSQLLLDDFLVDEFTKTFQKHFPKLNFGHTANHFWCERCQKHLLNFKDLLLHEESMNIIKNPRQVADLVKEEFAMDASDMTDYFFVQTPVDETHYKIEHDVKCEYSDDDDVFDENEELDLQLKLEAGERMPPFEMFAELPQLKIEEVHLKSEPEELVASNKVEAVSEVRGSKRRPWSKTVRCDLCPYQTKYGNCVLNRHMLSHAPVEDKIRRKLEKAKKEKDKEGEEILRCGVCPYMTRRQYCLNMHEYAHKKGKELRRTVYACSECSYTSRHRGHLNRHAATHKNPVERQKYECELCSCKLQSKTNLSNHLKMKHQVLRKADMLTCNVCGYKTPVRDLLNKHMKVHKPKSQLKMFRCKLCSYESRYKSSLRDHLVTHKDAKETELYRCAQCRFVSKHRRSIKMHLLKHKQSS